jgi:hypothetical protein
LSFNEIVGAQSDPNLRRATVRREDEKIERRSERKN